MKALSVKNPWPLLIALGIKDIENRTWHTTYRGRIYIHSSAKGTDLNVVRILHDKGVLMTISGSQYHRVIGKNDSAAIIGEVDIVDCVLNHPSVWAEHTAIKIKMVGNKETEVEVPVYNWVLANPVLYDQPIENVKGALSLWDYQININQSLLQHPL